VHTLDGKEREKKQKSIQCMVHNVCGKVRAIAFSVRLGQATSKTKEIKDNMVAWPKHRKLASLSNFFILFLIWPESLHSLLQCVRPNIKKK
jgi:hypothetical protein